jgi:hypothetical protein
MPDPIVTQNNTAPVTAVAPGGQTPVSPVPGAPAQPTPGAAAPQVNPPQPGASAPAAGQPGMVPLPALQEERSRRQALEAEVENLKRLVQPGNQPQQPVVVPGQQPLQADPRVELEKLWDTDPRKAVQVEIMYAMDWRDRVDASLNVQADQLAARFSDFNNYRSTTLGYIRSLPAHQRTQPGILEAAYHMVRGQNVDMLLQQRENELMDKYRRGEITMAQAAAPGAGSFSAPAIQTGTVQLTQEQINVANAMGLTPDQYASQIKLPPPTGAR